MTDEYLDLSMNDIEKGLPLNTSINSDINELKEYITKREEEGSSNFFVEKHGGISSSDSEDDFPLNNKEQHYSLKIGSNSDDGTIEFQHKPFENDISVPEIKAILNTIEWDKYDLYHIREEIDKHFKTDMVTLTSNHLDIIASYLCSQKIIYLESSHITSKWLNALMIPTIVISCSASVLSGAGETIPHSSLIISCITAFGAFLLAIINYLKLDAASEAHKMTSHQYDKLQNHIMFLSGKTLLFSEASFSFHTFHDKLRRKTTEVNSSTSQQRLECHKKAKLKYQELRQKIINENLPEHVFIHKLEKLKDEYNKQKEKCNDEVDDVKQGLINDSIVELEKTDNKMQQILIDEIREEISILQKQIKEIKETNHFEIPQSIRHRFPFSYGTNVFSIIKSLEDFKCNLIHKLWIIKNNIKCSKVYIYTCKKLLSRYPNSKNIQNEITNILAFKNINHSKRKKLYEMIISLKSAYMEIDKLFTMELENDKIRSDYFLFSYLSPRYWCLNNCKPPFKKLKDNLLYKILNNKMGVFENIELDICQPESNYNKLVDY